MVAIGVWCSCTSEQGRGGAEKTGLFPLPLLPEQSLPTGLLPSPVYRETEVPMPELLGFTH